MYSFYFQSKPKSVRGSLSPEFHAVYPARTTFLIGTRVLKMHALRISEYFVEFSEPYKSLGGKHKK